MLFCDLTRRCLSLGFPGDSVVRTPSASTRDAGSIPGLGRSHVPQGSQARGPQLPSLCSRPRKPQVLSSQAARVEATHVHTARLSGALHSKGSHSDEKPEHRNEPQPEHCKRAPAGAPQRAPAGAPQRAPAGAPQRAPAGEKITRQRRPSPAKNK